MSDDVVVRLSKPVQSVSGNGDPMEITSVTLRRPIGLDLMRAGTVMRVIAAGDPDPDDPFSKAPGEMAVEVKMDGMGKLIARCARIPLRAVEQMDGADVIECSTVVQGFLGKDQTSKTPTGTPAASSAT